jgi:cob(I)alamin adenosyltransferase
MAKFNQQFATQKLRQEMSVTGTGATFTPGTGEQMATNKAFKKKPKTEEKDVEPKLAAGKAKVYMKDKWGWKDAPSIPNRPSKGGFMYKQLFEELNDFVKENKLNIKSIGDFNYNMSMLGLAAQQMRDEQMFNTLAKLRSQTDLMSAIAILDEIKMKIENAQNLDRITKKDALKAIENIRNEYEPEEQDDDEDNYDWFTDKHKPASDYGKYRKDPDYYEKDYKDKGTSDYFQRRSLDESYSKFKNETKTRGKSDQFHQAVREVRKKVQEINRLFEYVSRLKSELSEGEGGLKYKMHTEKALAKIKEMVSELNQNIKKFK